MLVSTERVCFSVKWYLSLIFIIILCSPQLSSAQVTQKQVCLQHEYYRHFMDYFSSLDENADIEEVIDNLILMRQAMVLQGYPCPTVRELCHNLLKGLAGTDVNVEDPVIQELVHRIQEREALLSQRCGRPTVELTKHKHKHKEKHKKEKKQRELHMGSRGIFGFVKILAGGLMCLVPVPGAQTLGITLIGYGLNDMIDDAREQGEEAAERQRDETALLGPATP